MLVLVAPCLLVAFTVARPGPLPAPTLPPSFDGRSASALADELARDYPNRVPGSRGADGAAGWVADKLALYGLRTSVDRWRARVPGLGKVDLQNLVAVVPGSSLDAIVFVAHRDNSVTGSAADDNATGTAALVELARAYATAGLVGTRPRPRHTIVFVSTDGGAFGGFGAEHFAETPNLAGSVRAVVALDGLGASRPSRLDISGFEPRSPAPALVRTAAIRVAEQTGEEPRRPGWLSQLVNLGMPFGFGEQGPFLGRRISAIRLGTAGEGRETSVTASLDEARFAELGRASQAILASLDGGVEIAAGTDGYVYLGGRIVRGWTIQLALLAALVPFGVGVVDLLVRSRRRRFPLGAAWRRLRTRLALWLWAGMLVALGAIAGLFPLGEPIPPPPDSSSVRDVPIAGLAVLAVLAVAGWWRAHRHLTSMLPLTAEEELSSATVALSALGVVAVVVGILNPYALIFVVPSLYSWLWLPQTPAGWLRYALYLIGLAGPAIAIVSLGSQIGVGLHAPLYVVALATLGCISWPTVLAVLVWGAAATQLGAITTSGYARRARQSSAR